MSDESVASRMLREQYWRNGAQDETRMPVSEVAAMRAKTLGFLPVATVHWELLPSIKWTGTGEQSPSIDTEPIPPSFPT